MLKFKEMTPAQMAEYVGGECDEELAAGVLSRCIEADYQYPHEVPEMHWSAFIEYACRDMWRPVETMTPTHTLGPWAIESRPTGGFDIDASFEDQRERVAFAINPSNARLIAAAPAMLQALLDALPYVEDVLSDPAALACFKPGTVERHAKAIRAAISAATED